MDSYTATFITVLMYGMVSLTNADLAMAIVIDIRIVASQMVLNEYIMCLHLYCLMMLLVA